MEQATTFHIGEKVRSYTIIFKLEVVDFAEKKSIAGALLSGINLMIRGIMIRRIISRLKRSVNHLKCVP